MGMAATHFDPAEIAALQIGKIVLMRDEVGQENPLCAAFDKNGGVGKKEVAMGGFNVTRDK